MNPSGWSRYGMVAKEREDPFGFPPSFDYFSGNNGYSAWDWQSEFPIQESFLDAVPLMESCPIDPLYCSLDIELSQTLTQEDLESGYGNNGFGIWNEMGGGFYLEPEKHEALLLCNGETHCEEFNEEKKAKRPDREDKSSSSSKMLSRDTISQYFYMPITQAAKELNVGLTLLKKRCRDLGIRRWPHRKLMSLQTLIKNVQELRKEEGEGSEARLKEAIEILERERKMLEEMPDTQLEDTTKRLRQACFKANYKKRKLMGMVDPQTSSSTSSRVSYEEEDEEMKTLLSDSFSSSNMMF